MIVEKNAGSNGECEIFVQREKGARFQIQEVGMEVVVVVVVAQGHLDSHHQLKSTRRARDCAANLITYEYMWLLQCSALCTYL
jgi:hypothetical protein